MMLVKDNNVTARDLITAAVAAGVVTGLLYSLATLWLSTPVIFSAEVVELGDAALVDKGLGRTLWTVVGGVAFATALSLVFTPMVRALGQAYWRNAATVAGVAMVGWLIVTGKFFPLSPPGVEHLQAVTVRQGGWLVTLLGFVCVMGLGLAVYRLVKKQPIGGMLPAVLVVCMAFVLAGLAVLGNPGLLGQTEPTEVPAQVIARFELMGMLCNVVMFLGLALSIPPALRRFTPQG